MVCTTFRLTLPAHALHGLHNPYPKGHDIYKKISIREDTLTVIAMPERSKCPRINQIRKLSVHDIAAKGPVWARSMARKILGNEEFCLQIDAHSEFVPGWDDKVKHEWAATGNEFGIISTVPPAIGDTEDENSVPRQCWVTFQEIGTPVRNLTLMYRCRLTHCLTSEPYFRRILREEMVKWKIYKNHYFPMRGVLVSVSQSVTWKSQRRMILSRPM